MAAYVACRSRIGAARLVLEEVVGTPMFDTASGLQLNALVTVLNRANIQKSLGPQEKACLTAMIVQSPFSNKHKEQALLSLQNGTDVQPTRRKQQNHLNFVNYLCSFEWSQIQANAYDANVVVQILLEVLVGRLNCINPSESLKKLVASIALYVGTHGRDLECLDVNEATKIKMLKYVKTCWKARTKRHAPIPPADYMLELPENPEDLLSGDFSHLYSRIKIPGCWQACKFNMMEIYFLDNSFGCRTGTGTSSEIMSRFMDIQTRMLKSIKSAREDSDDVVPIQYLAKPNRSQLALPRDTELRRARSVFDFREMDAGDPAEGAVMRRRRSSIFEDPMAHVSERREASAEARSMMAHVSERREASAEGRSVALRTHAAPGEVAVEALALSTQRHEASAEARSIALPSPTHAAPGEVADEALALPTHAAPAEAPAEARAEARSIALPSLTHAAPAEAPAETHIALHTHAAPSAMALASVEEASRARGDALLDAMLGKQKDSAAAKRLEKRKAAAAAKAQSSVVVASAQAESSVVVASAVASVVVASEESILATVAAAMKAKRLEKRKAASMEAIVLPENTGDSLPALETGVQFSKPCMSHEKSRCQYLCRTGLRGPGQSLRFSYHSKNGQYATAADALSAADAWLAERRADEFAGCSKKQKI